MWGFEENINKTQWRRSITVVLFWTWVINAHFDEITCRRIRNDIFLYFRQWKWNQGGSTPNRMTRAIAKVPKSTIHSTQAFSLLWLSSRVVTKALDCRCHCVFTIFIYFRVIRGVLRILPKWLIYLMTFVNFRGEYQGHRFSYYVSKPSMNWTP